ncbi:MAG: hypothetical protein GY906_29270 [bacterium]|nr:hypothetical protein [bacterium]
MADAIDELFDQAKEEREAEQWDFDEKSTIKGILIGATTVRGREYGPYYILRIKTKEDGTFAIPVWGTVLENQVVELAPKVGSPIGIQFLGLVDNKDGDRQYKDWIVVAGDNDLEAWVELAKKKAALKRGGGKVAATEEEDIGDLF